MDIRVQRSVINQLSLRPKSVEVGPFVIGWDPGTDSRFINYATPLLDTGVTGADVAALVAAFRKIDRVPRLEYVASCAPQLEGHLIAAGFTVEARHQYLVCSPETLVEPPCPAGCTIVEPATDTERAEVIAAQHEAFGGEPVASSGDVDRMRRNQSNGAIVLLARLTDGTVVGGGQAAPPGAGVVEVAGIAVRPPFRRRGIASAITAAVTQRAFAASTEAAWLEASGADSWRVYERVGYQPTGERLYITLG